MKKNNTIKGYYSLTSSQMGIFLDCVSRPDSTRYNLPIFMELPPLLPARILAMVCRKCIEKHAAFFTRIAIEKGEVKQYFYEKTDTRIPVLHMRERNVENIKRDMLRPFALQDSKLWRVVFVRTERKLYWLVNIHHLIFDGSSAIGMINEMMSLIKGKKNTPETENSFTLARAEKEFVLSDEYYVTLAQLRDKYKDFDNLRLQPARQNPWGNNITCSRFIDRQIIDTFLKEHRQISSNLFYAAYAICLATHLHSNNICFTSLYHGRRNKSMRNAVGMLVQTFAVMRKIDPKMQVQDFLNSFIKDIKECKNTAMPYSAVCKEIGFVPETMMTYQGPAISEDLHVGGMKFKVSQPHDGELTNSDLSIAVYVTRDKYELRCECSDAIHDQIFINRFTECLANTVVNVMKNINGKVGDVSVISDQERKELSLLERGATLKASTYTSLIEAIDHKANTHAEKEAVVGFDEDGKRFAYTYKQLKQKTDTVACYLKKNYPEASKFILEFDRRPEYIIAAIGVMKAGGCFIPIDPTYPAERKDFICKDSEAVCTLNTNLIINITKESLTTNCYWNQEAERLAYIIYTSGSTGNPKGVEISQRALWQFVQSISQVLELKQDDRISCHSNFCFDASIEDLFPVLTVGGTLYIVPEHLRRDINGMAEFLRQNNITGGNYTTIFGTLLLKETDLHVRYLVLGGEKMTHYPKRNRHIKLYNTYGPTEFCVDATYHLLQPDKEYTEIPIGKPLPGSFCRIIDQNGNGVGKEVCGELCLIGNQIASGYHNLPTETANAFVYDKNTEQMLYHTGDLAKWDTEGNLIYIRRKDQQVKLRGYRIELSEIEQAVEKTKNIEHAVVAINKAGQTSILCCYYTTTKGMSIDQEILKKQLEEQLPHYMVPDFFLAMESLPVTTSGKIDRSALPLPTITENNNREALSGKREETAYRIISEVMGIQSIGATDDLTRLGLTSIMAAEISVKLATENLIVSAIDILRLKTIRRIVSEKTEVCHRQSKRIQEKPTAVLVSGITWAPTLAELCQRLEQKYNLVIIESITEGDAEKSASKLIDEYIKMLNDLLEKDELVQTFVGHSFGGELALILAKKWSQHHNLSIKPNVLMIDSHTSLKMPDNINTYLEILHQKNIPDSMHNKIAAYIDSGRLALKVHKREHFRDYNTKGRVVLVNAQNKIFETKDNGEEMRQLIPQLEIINIDADHFSVLKNENIKKYIY